MLTAHEECTTTPEKSLAYYGLGNVSSPEKDPTDVEPTDDRLDFYSKASREQFQQAFYGCTFIPFRDLMPVSVYCAGVIYTPRRTLLNNSKQTHVFNRGAKSTNELSELKTSLRSFFSLENIHPRVQIPPRAWQTLLRGDPGFIFLEYPYLEIAEEVIARLDRRSIVQPWAQGGDRHHHHGRQKIVTLKFRQRSLFTPHSTLLSRGSGASSYSNVKARPSQDPNDRRSNHGHPRPNHRY